MLERLAGNAALKSELGAALRTGRLPHAILLVGEPGCGAGFAARCLAADYLYPQGGAHAEAVLNGTDTECVSLRGSGKSGGIPVDDVRAMREILEEPPADVLFLLTAPSAATVLPTIRSRCAAYTVAPVPADECCALLGSRGVPAPMAQELSFLYEGHIGKALQVFADADTRALLASAKKLLEHTARQDTYRALALLNGYEKNREGFAALLWQLEQLCSAVLRRPAYGADACGGLQPDAAARALQAIYSAKKDLTANGNLKLILAVLAADLCKTEPQ